MPTAPLALSCPAGGLMQGLNEDSVAVQNAISEKVGTFLRCVVTFVGGLAVAFWASWDVALVMLGAMPFIVGARRMGLAVLALMLLLLYALEIRVCGQDRGRWHVALCCAGGLAAHRRCVAACRSMPGPRMIISWR